MLENNLLKVSDIHSINYSTYGNKNGIPLLFIHGGPGGSSNLEKDLPNINLEKFYVVIFDQRGTGKSTPFGELKENETSFLIDDIKKLLDHLNIKKVVIHGESWGGFLSLAFATKYSSCIEKMFLKAPYIANYKDSDWLWGGSKTFLPDMYEKFITPIIKDKPANQTTPEYLSNCFTNGTIEEKKKITAGFCNYDFCTSNLTFSNKDFFKPEDASDDDVNFFKIFINYEKNYSFIEDNFILNNISKIENIPVVFYQARYDMICTFDAVYEIHTKMKNSTLKIISHEGHSGSMMKDLIMSEINDFKL